MSDDDPAVSTQTEMAEYFPGCDHISVAREVEDVLHQLIVEQMEERHLAEGSRKILGELAAAFKALDNLGPFAGQAVRDEMRVAWAEGYPWLNGEVVHLAIPDELPIGWMTIRTMMLAISRASERVRPQRGRKGYGRSVRTAARALVDIYCREAKAPMPYFDTRLSTVRHPGALNFAHRYLKDYCASDVPAPEDIVYLIAAKSCSN